MSAQISIVKIYTKKQIGDRFLSLLNISSFSSPTFSMSREARYLKDTNSDSIPSPHHLKLDPPTFPPTSLLADHRKLSVAEHSHS